jgi:hypothetical protein
MAQARVILHILLIATAAVALVGRPYVLDAVSKGVLEPYAVLIGPAAFAILLILFMLDAGARVFSKQPGKKKPRFGFAPVLLGMFLVALLLPSSIHEYKERTHAEDKKPRDYLLELANSKDLRVRTLVMSAASCQNEWTPELVTILERGLNDKEAPVQKSAKNAIAARLGLTFSPDETGTKEAKAALKAWSNNFFMAKKSVQ